jgi:fructose-bisphosphate aldolase class II
MSIVPLREILAPAFRDRYAVAAFNVVNDLTMDAVLGAAAEARSPVIVQTSAKTVRSVGSELLVSMFRAMAEGIEVPVTLHLDHCPDRALISECLAAGWNSVLFDGSGLPVEENQRQTREVVKEARRYGADVEGEIEGIRGVEDDVGSEFGSVQSLEAVIEFIETTGVTCFAPAVGTAHGHYTAAPVLDFERVTKVVNAVAIPLVLHGGTGLAREQFQEMASRGCAKINISTALKTVFMTANLRFLQDAAISESWDPPALFRYVGDELRRMARSYLEQFESVGRAA